LYPDDGAGNDALVEGDPVVERALSEAQGLALDFDGVAALAVGAD
jgi:hypothetical protein